MIKIIKHKNISDTELHDIILIKNLHWPYSNEQHLKWMSNNLTSDDVHFLIYTSEKLIAYMNLVNVVAILDNISIPFLGVGNVCTKYKGSGDGAKLMQSANNFILQNNKRGLLFCRDQLVVFYKKYEWIEVNNIYKNINVSTMIFNCTEVVSNFEYKDRLF